MVDINIVDAFIVYAPIYVGQDEVFKHYISMSLGYVSCFYKFWLANIINFI